MTPRRSATPGLSRSGLVVGLVGICVVGAVLAFMFAKLRPSPDAGRLIYATEKAVYVHDLTSGKDSKALSLPDGTVVASASPNGKWIGYSTEDGAVWLVRIDGTQRFQVTDNLTVSLGWTPDNKLVVGELASDGDLVAVDPEGARTPLMTGGHLVNTVPVFLDAQRFAIAQEHKKFMVIENTGEVLTASGTPLTASPDGAQLMYADGRSVKLVTVKGAELTSPSVVFHGTARAAATSPNGYVALVAKDAHDNSGVWVFQGGTTSTRIVSGKVQGVTWTKAGAIVVYLRSGVLYAQDAHGSKPKRVSRAGAKVLPLLSFSVVG